MFEICAIFKNEARYLREWVEFHLLQGFDHFRLYDNGSSDDSTAVLSPYVECGVVSLRSWDAPLRDGWSHQIEAYRDCLASSQGAEWVGFIDTDEFLYSGTEDRFVDALSQYAEYPGVVIPWTVFGSAGLVEDDGGLVIERFTRCGRAPDSLVKSVIRVSHGFEITSEGGVHTFLPRDRQGRYPVSEAGLEVPVKKNIFGLTSHVFRCNHYPVKSREEFCRKVEKGREYLGGRFDTPVDEYLARFDKNEIEDVQIQRFVPKLKNALGLSLSQDRLVKL